MQVYIGLDVSLASTAICVLGEKGEIVTEAQVASAPDALVSFLREQPHGNWLKAWALRLAVLRGRKRATVALERQLPGGVRTR